MEKEEKLRTLSLTAEEWDELREAVHDALQETVRKAELYRGRPRARSFEQEALARHSLLLKLDAEPPAEEAKPAETSAGNTLRPVVNALRQLGARSDVVGISSVLTEEEVDGEPLFDTPLRRYKIMFRDMTDLESWERKTRRGERMVFSLSSDAPAFLFNIRIY